MPTNITAFNKQRRRIASSPEWRNRENRGNKRGKEAQVLTPPGVFRSPRRSPSRGTHVRTPADPCDRDVVGPDDAREVVLECAAAAGYRALEIRPRITVPAGRETWKRFATTGTAEDIAAARVAVDTRLAGVGAKP